MLLPSSLVALSCCPYNSVLRLAAWLAFIPSIIPNRCLVSRSSAATLASSVMVKPNLAPADVMLDISELIATNCFCPIAAIISLLSRMRLADAVALMPNRCRLLMVLTAAWPVPSNPIPTCPRSASVLPRLYALFAKNARPVTATLTAPVPSATILSAMKFSPLPRVFLPVLASSRIPCSSLICSSCIFS